LEQRARVSPNQRALRFQRHGVWLSQSWGQFRLTVELATHVWRSLGVGEGSHIALIGPFSELALATVLAAEVLGGTTDWVQSGDAGDAQAHPAAWLVDGAGDLSGLPDAAWRDGLVVVRQSLGVPAGTTGRLHTFDQLLADLPDAVVPALPVGSALSRPLKDASAPTWLVAGLSHGITLREVLGLWLTQAWVLALPEPGGNIHLDRRALQPDAVIDTPQGLAALASHASERWPAAEGLRSSLIAWALAGRRVGQRDSITNGVTTSAMPQWGLRSWLAGRVLNRLGLSRARVLVVDGAAAISDEAWVVRLGLPIQTWPAFAGSVAKSTPAGAVPEAAEFELDGEISGLGGAAS
jgi:hypothetical protein